MRWLLVILGVAVLSYAPVMFAQEEDVAVRVEFDAETLSPALGEPFRLSLRVLAPPDAVVVFPAIPSEWGGFSVLEVYEPEVRTNETQAEHLLALDVVGWGVGSFPPP